jgi:integrase
MLNEYYVEGSKYLQDDTASNKRDIVHKSRKEAQTFIETDLIPYLREKKIKTFREFTTPVYSGFKIYLQAKGIKDKTINNRLNYLIRIFEYHLRNGLLEKLPYTKGTALLRITGKQEKEDAEVLPIEKLKGIYPHWKLIDPIALTRFLNPLTPAIDFSELSSRDRKAIFNNYILPFTLGVLALNTGMRNSEIGRIKREDFIGVQERKTFLLRAWNKKTEYYNKTSESKYRKIPLHTFTIETVKCYIKRKEELYGIIKDTDFLFGKTTIDKDTGETDGFLHYRVFDKAVLLILKLIKHKDNFDDFFTNTKELLETMENAKELQEELREIKEAGKSISFYSFRKTFRTMLGLSNDLAEYYIGHKLGDDSKTTYIQVNSLDNKLFVDEYAAPVISMLDKFVFYSDEELNRMKAEDEIKMKERIDFLNDEITAGVSFGDALINYDIKELKESEKQRANNTKDYDYFERI